MKKFLSIAFAAILLAAMTVSCTKDLDIEPIDPNQLTSNIVFDSPESYTYALAKLYASFSVSGQRGPSGLPDISGIDEGFGNYLRQYWNAQELSTDEAVMAWNDQTIKDFHWQTWAPNDVFIGAVYSRIFFTISISNELVRATAGKTESDMVRYNAEARFVRALAYYHALDLFGNPPFVTEADLPGTFYPAQTNAADLFAYIESELKAIENNLGAPRFEYGRADKAAAWTLLAKLYLNASVYIGEDKSTECLEYCNKVLDAGYSLALPNVPNGIPSGYLRNFSADNNTSPEIIFAINCDGQYTQSYGGMTYLIHAAVGGSMNPADFGIGSGWGGIRTTKALVYKFDPEAVKSPNPMLRFGKQGILKNTNYDVIEVPGAHQGWDPATAPQLASVGGDGIYEGYVWFPDALNAFKFTQGGNWDTNWGDSGGDGTLEPGGDNIVATEAGYYKLVVDLNTLTYTMTLTDWGVIGSATAGGWDSDQNMTYDAATGLWSATLSLSAGELNFRANAGWDLNYGDDGANGILETGGANIVIPQGGICLITMKLGTPDYTYTIEMADSRALFWTDKQSLEINDIGQFTEGWGITKFRNVNGDGSEAIHPHDDFVCTDYPMFRLADVYLMYAEAVLRGGSGGDRGTALDLVNQIRERAYGNSSGNINDGELNLDFILDERARELYWEGHRRTDLIRFGQFTNGTYVWPWKGKAFDGTQVPAYRNLYPIPSADMNANPNLKQNFGY